MKIIMSLSETRTEGYEEATKRGTEFTYVNEYRSKEADEVGRRL